MKYEYKVREFPTVYPSGKEATIPKVVVDDMNALGKEGYELVSTVPFTAGIGTIRYVFIYKREILG